MGGGTAPLRPEHQRFIRTDRSGPLGHFLFDARNHQRFERSIRSRLRITALTGQRKEL